MAIGQMVASTFKKACNFIGLNEMAESVSDRVGQVVDLDDHRYPSFSELFPYQYFDKDSKIFFNKNQNKGVMYRIVPLTGANERLAEQLDNVLRTKISSDFTMHMVLVKHNQIGNELDRFARQFESKEFENLKVLGQNLKAFYAQAAKKGFKTNSTVNPRLTNTECFVVIDRAVTETEQEASAVFARFKTSFEAALSAAKIGFAQADATDFLHLLSFYLSNDPDYIYPKRKKYNESLALKYQSTDKDFDLEIESDHLFISGVNDQGKSFETAVSTLTIDELPEEYMFWQNIDNASNIDSPEQSIPCNHIISVTYKVVESSKAQNKANRKAGSLDKKAKSQYANVVANTEKLASQWRIYRDDLVGQQTRAVKMLYNVILFSRPEEKERDVEVARSAFLYSGIRLGLCKRFQINYFLASMPFMFTGKMDYDFRLPTMMSEISSWNATQYMPVLSDWAGIGNGVLFPTNREQFACIDPFSGFFGTNFNMAVSGTTGSGKSFAMQMLLLNVLFNGGDVFIIDIGGSYKKSCEALGGTYLEYDNLAMNPFTHVKDLMSEIDEIISLFELLACPRDSASDDDVGTLREAILNAYSNKGNETLIDDVQQSLLELYKNDKDSYPSARILSKNLQRYSSTSEHGKVFNKPSSLSPTARFIVVDLKGIEDNVAIRAPVLLSVISQFQRRMFDSDRSKQKMCIIDEAWKFFTGDKVAANFITKGYRTGRKHNASFVTLTQGIDDFYEFEEARAAWDNSALKLIFMQDHDSLMEHKKNHDTFTPYEVNLLNKFPKAKDAGYSQVLIKANGISSFHRLFVDPFTLVLFSSDGKDYQAVHNYTAQNIPFFEAVERVAREHYGALYA